MARQKRRAAKSGGAGGDANVPEPKDVETQVADSVTVVLAGDGEADPSVKVSMFAIDFPGFVSSNDAAATNALRTVGGLSGLQDQRSTHPKQLKVKLRPDDPYCHPVMGTSKRSTSLMLLKLAYEVPEDQAEEGDGRRAASEATSKATSRARNSKKKTTTADRKTAPPTVIDGSSSVVMVDELYSFRHPADLQLDSLTKMSKMSSSVAHAEKDTVPHHSQPYGVGGSNYPVQTPYGSQGYHPYGHQSHGAKDKHKVACVPAVFLVEGTAEYGVDTYGAGRESGVPSYLATRGNNEIIVDYGVATATLEKLVKDDNVYYDASFKEDDPRLSKVGHALRKIFLERPVYAGAPLALAVKSKIEEDEEREGDRRHDDVFSDADANDQLGKLCYRFSSGPWRGCWVRKGYDPRKDSHAGKYQVVTLDIRGRGDRDAVTAANAMTSPSKAAGRSSGGWSYVGSSASGWSNADDYGAVCALDASLINHYPARMQLVDIQDEDVRGRLKQGGAKQSDRHIGWLTASEMNKVCARIIEAMGEANVIVAASESDDLRVLPFSTINTFGTNSAPILAASDRKRPDGDGDREERPLFDILPTEYHEVIAKMGLK